MALDSTKVDSFDLEEMEVLEKMEVDYPTQTREEQMAMAERLNCDFISDEPNVLLCDLDSPIAWQSFHSKLDKMNWLPIMSVETWKSGGGNNHAKVILGMNIPLAVRIHIQTLLGSDPKRSLIAVRDLVKTGETSQCLFKPRRG